MLLKYRDENFIAHGTTEVCEIEEGKEFLMIGWPAGYSILTYDEAEIIRQSKIVPLTYQQKRAQLYAPIADQLDMIYHDQINGTTVWKDHIAQVKTAVPKT